MPGRFTWITRFLPLTHALVLMRYGLLGDNTGLHNVLAPGLRGERAAGLGIVAALQSEAPCGQRPSGRSAANILRAAA